MKKNNFQELEEQLISDSDLSLQHVRSNIGKSRDVFQVIGSFVELFFPKLLDVLTGFVGGNEESKPSSHTQKNN